MGFGTWLGGWNRGHVGQVEVNKGDFEGSAGWVSWL